MPRQTAPESDIEIAQREIQEEIEQAIAALAADTGPAPRAVRLSDAEKVEMWGRSDPKVDYGQLLQQLMATGLPPEMLDPDTGLAIFKRHPEMAQLYGQPVAPEVADPLARLAEYPLRLSLLEHLEDDPKARVEEANRLDAAWEKRWADAYRPSMPLPDGPSPTPIDGGLASAVKSAASQAVPAGSVPPSTAPTPPDVSQMGG